MLTELRRGSSFTRFKKETTSNSQCCLTICMEGAATVQQLSVARTRR